MENRKVIMDARVLAGVFLLALGLLFIPLSLVPSIDKHFYAQTSTEQVAEDMCPPDMFLYLDDGSYRIKLGGPFIIGPSTCVEVRSVTGDVIYQSSIDPQKRDEQLDFNVIEPAHYTIAIDNGAARIELSKLVGHTVWFDAATYPGQPLMIIGLVLVIVGIAILLVKRELNSRACPQAIAARLEQGPSTC